MKSSKRFPLPGTRFVVMKVPRQINVLFISDFAITLYYCLEKYILVGAGAEPQRRAKARSVVKLKVSMIWYPLAVPAVTGSDGNLLSAQ